MKNRTVVSEFTGDVKDKKLLVGRNPSSIEGYASIEDNGQLDTSYQFISIPVSTVLGHLKRGFFKKGEQVCV